jgi:hypothetical protein
MPDHSVRYKTFWAGDETWDTPDDPQTVTLAQVVRPLVAGSIIGLRYLRSPSDESFHIGMIRRIDTQAFQRVFLFREWDAPATAEWQTTYFNREYHMEANDKVQIAVCFGDGGYSRILHFSDGGDVTHGNIVFDNLEEFGAPSGAFNYDPLDFATASFLNCAYGIDLVFREDV